VKKALAERADAAKAAKDEPGQANRLYFRSFFFGPNHPYGRPAEGDEVTLARINQASIVTHHRSLFTAKNTMLAVAGDFDPAVMLPAVRQALAAMPAGAAYSWKTAQAPRHTTARLLLVDAPEATQTYFIIAQPGIERTHPDRTALMLVNTLFGDRFTSMLNDELRVNSGLTYGARSVVQQDRLPGALSITTFTKTETTVQAMDLALDVLRRLREKGIDSEQLKSAKAYVKGNYPIEQLETAGQVAGVIGDIELFGLNRGEVDDLFSRIDAVTPEQATEVARRHFRQESLQFCLTGAAAKIKDAVAKYAPGNMRVLPASAPGFQVDW
jgi:predicted Zn-dependent peptidase